ncbi:MAG TPA: hypothetical protein PKH93_09880 [Chitinophagales bacterium]|nr:hypothetical protein [Chitinophagales bacterium]
MAFPTVGLLRASLRLVLRYSPHWLTPPSASLTRFATRTSDDMVLNNNISFRQNNQNRTVAAFWVIPNFNTAQK